MAPKSKPEWKNFEEDIYAIQIAVGGVDTKVTYDDRIVGFNSGAERQIDVSLRTSIANHPCLVALECKAKGRRVDVAAMDAFASMLLDIKANKGILISKSGFTPAALQTAKNRGIDALTSAKNEALGEQKFVPCTIRFRKTQVSILPFVVLPFAPNLAEPNRNQLSIRPKHLLWSELPGARTSVESAICALGKSGVIPKENGHYDFLLGEVEVKTAASKVLSPVYVNFRVKNTFYWGTIPWEEELLLLDQKSGVDRSRVLRTPFIPVRPWDDTSGNFIEIPFFDAVAITPLLDVFQEPGWDHLESSPISQ